MFFFYIYINRTKEVFWLSAAQLCAVGKDWCLNLEGDKRVVFFSVPKHAT